MIFHITCSQGRADTFYLEALSHSKVLIFLNTVSTAIVRNIKQVVYSKQFNINYISGAPFVPSLVFHKVIVYAFSKSYSKQYTLYNVKKTVTKSIIETEFKKMLIDNEPIIGFYDISFYNEVTKSENIDNLYQVQYTRNSKTYVEDFYFSSYDKVKSFFETCIDGELLEIRKYVHTDNTVKKDDGLYFKRISFYITNANSFFGSSIPKIKKTISIITFKQLLLTNLTFKNLPIDSDLLKMTMR